MFNFAADLILKEERRDVSLFFIIFIPTEEIWESADTRYSYLSLSEMKRTKPDLSLGFFQVVTLKGPSWPVHISAHPFQTLSLKRMTVLSSHFISPSLTPNLIWDRGIKHVHDFKPILAVSPTGCLSRRVHYSDCTFKPLNSLHQSSSSSLEPEKKALPAFFILSSSDSTSALSVASVDKD